jgi:hypothetical protein
VTSQAAARRPERARREGLRRRYRPSRVRVLFVGEAPPSSGRFFYQRDSGLYRALRQAFLAALPREPARDFLLTFRARGCYLVDLCGEPVDDLDAEARAALRRAGEAALARTIRRLRPETVVTLVRAIVPNVRRAEADAGWEGERLDVPYPGRWHAHRQAFTTVFVPWLRRAIPPPARPRTEKRAVRAMARGPA